MKITISNDEKKKCYNAFVSNWNWICKLKLQLKWFCFIQLSNNHGLMHNQKRKRERRKEKKITWEANCIFARLYHFLIFFTMKVRMTHTHSMTMQNHNRLTVLTDICTPSNWFRKIVHGYFFISLSLLLLLLLYFFSLFRFFFILCSFTWMEIFVVWSVKCIVRCIKCARHAKNSFWYGECYSQMDSVNSSSVVKMKEKKS